MMAAPLKLGIALLAGVVADLYGVISAVWLVAAMTFLSGVIAAVRMCESRPNK